MLTQVIQVFFKAPIPGKVKTRLIPAIGLDASVAVHKRLCDGVIDTVIEYAQHSKGRVSVEFWTDLDIHHPYIQSKAAETGVAVYQQQGNDLGEKMCFALSQGLSRADQVCVVGGDCFSLSVEYLEAASIQLQTHDVVFGPADDGGYILLGATSLSSGMLDNIHWGESSVLAASIEGVTRAGYHVGLLEERWDIDTWEDIQQHAPQLLEGLAS